MDIEQYLNPVSGDNPCGDNKYDDFDYGGILSSDLEGIVGSSQGMVSGETEGSGSGDWSSLLSKVGGFFGLTKHLGLAYYATMADTRLSGLDGLLSGLILYNQLLSRHWDDVFPIIDEGDADERLEFITALNDISILNSISEVEVARGRQAGTYSLKEVMSSQASGNPEPALVEASINETLVADPDFYDTLHANIADIREQLSQIIDTVEESIEGGQVSLAPLEERLTQLESVISSASSGGGGAVLEEEGEPLLDDGGNPVTKKSGEISSRSDVCDAIDRVVRFYSRNEPTSPVPELLKRAKRMVNMNFMEIVEEFRLTQRTFEPNDIFGESNDIYGETNQD